MAYIDRELMLAKIREKAMTKFDWSEQIDVEDFEAVINELPTADVVEVKHGEWKECFEDWRKQLNGDECSVCGFQHYGASITHYHYCPNCGAKMDGRSDT